MSTDNPTHPPDDGWIAAIHASEGDFAPLGTALVIDPQRVLTCAHLVVSGHGDLRQPLWVAFPKGGQLPGHRVRVASIVVAENPRVVDLAVLSLAETIPAWIMPAPLRSPKPSDLVGRRWWAFGFANGDPMGNSADGLVGAALGYGWIRLDAESRYHVEPGFSGGGLWSPDYAAVVALVGEANARGDAHAITLHQADASLPGEKLAMLANWSAEAADEIALAAWGWTLARDPEAGRHWQPRARGVSIDSERGYRFRGRTAALTKIIEWLDRPVPDRQALVVTGSPGVGKSAVLGRIVTTADAAVRAAMPADGAAVCASLRSVACAVHAKGKTALEVATEIARAASARLPDDAADIGPALADALAERRQRFNVIIDALDEATTPAQARAIITNIVLPLVETCSGVGAQIVVGSRRRDDGGDLLTVFGNALTILDLDDPRYFADADLAAYAVACLQLAGDERPDNPYVDDAMAVPLAHRIANLAGRNFLIAGLVARDHGLHDTKAAVPEGLAFTATVDSALASYLERVNTIADVPADKALTALAFAEAPGLPIDLWQMAISTVSGQDISAEQLGRFARSSAASFLVESSTDGRVPVFRLFHNALNEALLHTRGQAVLRSEDELALSTAFIRQGKQAGWSRAPDYLLRSLAAHCAQAGVIDDLLTDDSYLLHADLRRLIALADLTVSAAGHDRARLLHLTPQAIAADPATRAALFSVTEVMERLRLSGADASSSMPYRARWAWVRSRIERAVLDGHSDKVRGICAFTLDERLLLASASHDATVRIWDPVTGEQQSVLQGHARLTSDVCAFQLNSRFSLAAVGADCTVRIWDPATGDQQATLEGNNRDVRGLCAFTVEERVLLAAADDQIVLIWDLATGKLQTTVAGHTGPVTAICAFTLDGRVLLASAGGDGTVRIWDPAAHEQVTVLKGHADWIWAVCAFTVDGRALLASASDDRTVRIWDPASQMQQETILSGHAGWVRAVCPFTAYGRIMFASAGDDHLVRIWDPAVGEQQAILKGHALEVNGVCQFTLKGQDMLASASNDRTVRIWDLPDGQESAVLHGHSDWVVDVCAFTLKGRPLLASASYDGTARIWDPAGGRQVAVLQGHNGAVNGICTFTLDRWILLATASFDRSVRIWEPASGRQLATLQGHNGAVNGICSFALDSQVLLATASSDHTVRIWNPATGSQLASLEGHDHDVNGICAFSLQGRVLLGTASDDRTVRIWEPSTAKCLLTAPVHHEASAISYAADQLLIALSAGVLSVELNASLFT